mgnify:CR=1 FL=1|jgi:uncharacterized repeat protein (TIGR04002 family)
MANKKLRLLVYTAFFMALTAVTTAVVKIPSGKGYIHVGDAINYLGSVILPFPFGIASGAVGGALSDAMLGYYAYVIPTLIIKAFNSSMFYILKAQGKKIISIRSIIALILTSFVTVIGYYFVGVILYGGFKAQLIATVPDNAIQALGSALIFIILGIAFDKSKVVSRLSLK